MSLVVLACMIAYGALRVALWLRGQWRFYRLRGELPRAAARVQAPAHLNHPLNDRWLGHSHLARVRLVASARQVATVLIVDPDVPLGCVRDFRYRLALADACPAAAGWLQRWHALSEPERRQIEELGYSPRRFEGDYARLAQVARSSVRAPALEPFAVAEVRAVQRLLMALVSDLEGCERALTSGPRESPYRGVGVTRGA